MSTASSTTAVSAGARTLQDRLHELITKLAATTELVKNWPGSEGDDASIHVETTTKLIANINSIIAAVQRVDGVVKEDKELRKNLQECLIPMDLLDLLDHGNGLNPDCFSRALLREAQGQLQGLKRRKTALGMLGAAVQSGLKQRLEQENTPTKTETPTKKESPGSASPKQSPGSPKRNDNKRKLEEQQEESQSITVKQEADDETKEPPTKKQHVE